jgi:hypothetical protein
MLFNKKLVMGLINTIGVLLILSFILNVVMYIWAYFGHAPLPFFDVSNGIISYYVLLDKLATLVFFYAFLGALAALVKGSKLQEGFKK